MESGIPPLRGPGSLWGKYDPHTLELDYFLAHPDKAWRVIREIFYDNLGKAKPNGAYVALAHLESRGTGPDGHDRLRVLITQEHRHLALALDVQDASIAGDTRMKSPHSWLQLGFW